MTDRRRRPPEPEPERPRRARSRPDGGRPAGQRPARPAAGGERPAGRRAAGSRTAGPTSGGERSARTSPGGASAGGRRASRSTGRVGADRRALGRVDGVRGERDGTAVAARRARQGRRRLVGGLAATVILVGVLFVAVFPVTTYRTQRAATVRAERELAEVREKRERVKRASDLLETAPEIERRARQELGYQMPGEDVYNLLPAPSQPIGLPDAWPFTDVERVLGAS